MKTNKQGNLRNLSRVMLLFIIVLMTSTITQAQDIPLTEATDLVAVSFSGSSDSNLTPHSYDFSQPVVQGQGPAGVVKEASLGFE